MTEAVPLSSFLLAVSCIDKSVFGVTQLGSMTLPGKQLTAVPLKVSSTWRLYSIVYSVLLLVLAPLNPYILLLSKVGSMSGFFVFLPGKTLSRWCITVCYKFNVWAFVLHVE